MAGLDADALKRGWFDFRRKRFWAWILLALYALFGFVVAPLIVRSVIVSEIHSLLGLDATLDDVDINPFALTVRLEKFAIADAKKAPLRSVRRTGCQRAAVEHRESRVVRSSELPPRAPVRCASNATRRAG